MSTDTPAARRTAVLLLCALTLAVTLPATMAPAVHAADTCLVRNVTQGTHGTSFTVMVKAAVDGDRLTVRGTCLARGVVVAVDVGIRGVGDRRATLDAHGRGSVLRVRTSAVVTLTHLVIIGGHGVDHGGGIANDGTLTLIDSVVRGNTGSCGGGIHDQGTLTLTRSVVRDNRADKDGGIYDFWDATLRLIDSVVRDNRAEEGGGGILNHGTLTLTGSAVLGRATEFGGGGIWNHDHPEFAGTVIVRGGSTVTSNDPDDCYGTTAC